MDEERCAGRDLMRFLGSPGGNSEEPTCTHTPDVVVLARNRHGMGRQVFLLCDECLRKFLGTRQHLDGWVQNYRERHVKRVHAGRHQRPQR